MGRELIFNNEFEKLYNYDGELGVVYSKENSKFILWAPTAEKVDLVLYGDDGYDYKNHEVYDLEDEDENLDMRDMMQFDSKILMYLGVGIALGALGVYLLRR